MNSKQRRRRLLAVPVTFALLLAACGGGSDGDGGGGGGGDTPSNSADGGGGDGGGDTPQQTVPDTDTSVVLADDVDERTYGGSVVFGIEAEAPGLRPWEDACGEPCLNIHATIFEYLMRRTAEGTYAGWLAESITPNDDFSVWTMTLRDGIEFHNGVALTAQTIVDMFAIQQGGAISSATISAAKLDTVEATGELEVTYTLTTGNSAFPASLAGVLGTVFEPAAAADDPDAFSTDPVGTGPFVIDKRDIGNETVVVRNESYWRSDANGNQLPYLDSIAFRPIPDENTRLDALLSGTVDMMHSLRQSTVRDARPNVPNITLYEFQGNSTGGGMYNTQSPPFDDLRVRQGLNRLIEQESYIAALGGEGISLPATQWFSPDDPFWTQEAADAWLTFDFPGGQALLQEYIADPARSDGKAPGEPIDVTLQCPPDPSLTAAMQVLEQVWTGSGLVEVTLTQFDQPTQINMAINDQHHAICWRWGANQDPSLVLDPFIAPSSESVANFPNNDNAESWALAQQATQTDDFDARRAMYSQIMINIANDAPIWYSGHTATMVATTPAVQGINGWVLPDGELGDGFPSSVVTFTEVWVKQ